MPFDPKTLQSIAKLEQELGPFNTVLPEGLYHFAVRADKSEVSDASGYPVLRLGFEVLEPEEHRGRIHSEFLRWFANENSESEKTWEERTKLARRITGGFFRDLLVKGLAESPSMTPDLAAQVDEAIAGFGDSPDSTMEMMEAVAEVLDGVDFYGRIIHKTVNDEVRTRLRFVRYSDGAAKLSGVPMEI